MKITTLAGLFHVSCQKSPVEASYFAFPTVKSCQLLILIFFIIIFQTEEVYPCEPFLVLGLGQLCVCL